MIERDAMIELTREELIARLDREARQRRGLSARELLRAYRAAQLDQPGEVADLLALAGLLPDDDPLLVAS